jgi:nitrogen regulatory protein PII
LSAARKNLTKLKLFFVGTSRAVEMATASSKNFGVEKVMKRIELVMEPSALDRFTEAARAMNLSDFDVIEVRRFPSRDRQERQRLYRGQMFVADFEERLKVDINVSNEAANRIAATLIAKVNPESVAILMLDRATVVEDLPASRGNPILRAAAFATH